MPAGCTAQSKGGSGSGEMCIVAVVANMAVDVDVISGGGGGGGVSGGYGGEKSRNSLGIHGMKKRACSCLPSQAVAGGTRNTEGVICGGE